jgi:hypothetical protein
MNVCDKPVGEQSASEVLNCAWSVTKESVVSVVNHPGDANVTAWMLTIFAALVVLFLLSTFVRR